MPSNYFTVVLDETNITVLWVANLDLLEVTHEGSSEVKCSKIDLLMSIYELFVMEPRESFQEMFTKFTNITNELVSLGRHIPADE